MKETAAKRRDKAGGRDTKAEKPKGPEPQDVEMPEEEVTGAAKVKEQDSLTLEGTYYRELPRDRPGQTGTAAGLPALLAV